MTKAPGILIISSPSGAGKTTLCRKLLEKHSADFVGAVSHTTRKPRPGEVHGREYYFVSDRVFDAMLDANQFLEHASVHTSRYGTARDEVVRIFAAGKHMLLDIDWQGTEQVKWAYPKARTVFVLPPSMGELARRLRGRKTDDEAEVKVRLANAADELSHYDLYDHLIANDDLRAAFGDLESIALGGEPLRPAPTLDEIETLIAEVGE